MPVPRDTPLFFEEGLHDLLPGNLYRVAVKWRQQDCQDAKHPRRSAKGSRSSPREAGESRHRSNRGAKADLRQARAIKRKAEEEALNKLDTLALAA